MLDREEQGNNQNNNCFSISKKTVQIFYSPKITCGSAIARHQKCVKSRKQLIFPTITIVVVHLLHFTVVLFQIANRNNVIDLPEFYLKI